jgi:carbamoylphosphate synthase small subunit
MKAILVLEDGSIFEGFSFGSEADAYGEVVLQYQYVRIPGNC